MKLNYIFPDGEVIETGMYVDTPYFDLWLQTMVDLNPDTIFFLTVPTTDVFDYLTKG